MPGGHGNQTRENRDMVGKVSLLLGAAAVLLGGAVLVQDQKPPAGDTPVLKIGFVDMFRVQEQSTQQKEAFGKLKDEVGPVTQVPQDPATLFLLEIPVNG